MKKKQKRDYFVRATIIVKIEGESYKEAAPKVSRMLRRSSLDHLIVRRKIASGTAYDPRKISSCGERFFVCKFCGKRDIYMTRTGDTISWRDL